MGSSAVLTTLLFCALAVHCSADGVFWHVTDFHYDFTYLNGAEGGKICDSQTAGQPTPSDPGSWGDYLCDAPWRLINDTVHAMKDIEPNPDFIIWTGDDTPHIYNNKMNTGVVLTIIGNLTDLLRTVFPNTQVYPVFGNHDYHPKHQMPPEPNTVYNATWSMWNVPNWLSDDVKNTFVNGAYYTMPISPGLRLVGLNTVYYYTNDRVTAPTDDNTDPAGQFSWLEGVLQQAATDNEKVFLIGHVPPGFFERSKGKSWFYPEYNRRYLQVVTRHADVIRGQFFAHQHCDSFKLFYDDEGRAVNSMLLAPAVTPWTTTLDGVGGNNPGIRLVSYNKNTGDLTDVAQYFSNLALANMQGSPLWAREYSLKDTFNLADASPASLQNLLDSFSDRSSDNFEKYYLYNSVSLDRSTCDEDCKVAQLCAIKEVDYDKYADCTNAPGSGADTAQVSTLTSFGMFLLFVMAAFGLSA
ncbi:PREDICTED: acid sphingomyelinase-like phosphodiesterase 3b [Branchiostoma belcheri]|uniref:Sphingomyelinase phosphodiesterase n=1 Tax=Branchiostoma belcheri TaxID=7741 RepID=A0A6P4YDI2_BRABE|nr:PREDICTED: acid sphingomyelinase-like phosphodiesterase 3b [Branchiostoma belcheri]